MIEESENPSSSLSTSPPISSSWLSLLVMLPVRIAWHVIHYLCKSRRGPSIYPPPTNLPSFIASIFPFSLILKSRILSGLLKSTTPSTTAAATTANNVADPQLSAAARFLALFESMYGRVHPEFNQGTYSQALGLAKREVRLFIAILHSQEHDDTPAFCRNVLCSDVFLNFLSEKNAIVWAGDISETEAFQVSSLLSVTRYPFMALIGLQSSKMVVIDRIEGQLNPNDIVARLQRSSGRVELIMAQMRADRQERVQSRQIREQQDEAYLASLRADQEKERIAREKKEKEQQQLELERKRELEEANRIEEKKKRQQTLIETLPPEPAADDPAVKLSIRLPSGVRVTRRFRPNDTLDMMIHFIETQKCLDPALSYEVVNTYPRKVFTDFKQTMKESGLYPSGAVVVEYI